MGDVTRSRWWRYGAVALVLAIGVALGATTSRSQSADPAQMFGTDVGVVLTFVKPDKTEDFERILAYVEAALKQSENPIRRQQAEAWRVYRSSDPGPNGAVSYVSFMDPVLKGADYSMPNILSEELPQDRADELAALFSDTLAQNQSTLSLDMFLHLTDPPVEPEEEITDDEDSEDLPLPDPTLDDAEVEAAATAP